MRESPKAVVRQAREADLEALLDLWEELTEHH